MPSNHTPNYQLNQWEADDRVRHEDFNADNAKIDAALKAEADARAAAVQAVAGTVPKIAVGAYTGNGAASRTISLPFTPKAVLVASITGRIVHDESVYDHYFYGGLAVTGGDVITPDNDTVLSVCSGGFRVFKNEVPEDETVSYFVWTNEAKEVFRYLAIG